MFLSSQAVKRYETKWGTLLFLEDAKRRKAVRRNDVPAVLAKREANVNKKEMQK
jgi:hypothetical protein